ncbi:MAG: FIST C-terminal domain-containing protein [Planctomycetes bacterium]|nr:FIST C-terminal domain-containing protein [Planctomycetota bacterium]
MQFHRALATGADPEAACREVAASLRAALGPGPIDLAFVFAAPRYGLAIDRVPVLLQDLLGARAIVGCSAAAMGDEVQVLEGNRHGIAVLAGRMPGATIHTVALATADLPSPDAPPAQWRALLPTTPSPHTGFVVLTEPFHFDTRALIGGLDFGFPGVPKIGGIASGSRHPDGHALFCGRTTHRAGAVLVALSGDVGLTTVSSQGCRPFGRVGRVTAAGRNRLLQIDDRPARAFIEEQLDGLSESERDAVHQSPLLLAITPDPFATSDPGDGEFLVCNILGVDQHGELVVAEHLPAGRTFRLLLRDESGTVDDLRARLRPHVHRHAGALQFRCLGRQGPDHAAFAQACPGVPLAGFHCNGEIAPTGGQTHLHAFSAVYALFHRRGEA